SLHRSQLRGPAIICRGARPNALYASLLFFFFSSRRRHTRSTRDWSSDVCSSDLSRYARSVRHLRAYLDACFPFHAVVTIVDNASTDGTQEIGGRLAGAVPGVHYIRLNDKGRGRALAAAWLISTADVVAYMDVDLSTNLDALLPLVAPVISHHSDLAIGSRLSTGARVRRGWKRELISRCYNALLRVALGATFTDAQCGFKAIRAETARRLIPQVENRSWFFDTELLVLAQRPSLRGA